MKKIKQNPKEHSLKINNQTSKKVNKIYIVAYN